MVRRVVIDIEGDGLFPTKIWCIVCHDLETDEMQWWDINSGYDGFKSYAEGVTQWIAHNGLSYDIPHINRLLGMSISLDDVLDTFVVSRTVAYKKYRTHGLAELGQSTGTQKTEYTGGWDNYSEEMLEYCKDDVTATVEVYNMYKKQIENPEWETALWCEHQMARICEDMNKNGFYFDHELAVTVLRQISERMNYLAGVFYTAWPPELVEVGSIKYRVRQDGELYPNVRASMENYPKTEVRGKDLILYDYVGFNPGSTKDRIEKLWEAGWQPVERSDTHQKFHVRGRVGQPWGNSGRKLTPKLFKEKQEYFKYYGWKVSDENLQTLPEDAPEGAFALAEWLTLNGRKLALEERLRQCEDDSRIHTKFWHIGAWTQRMSHSSPNLANISSPFHGEPKTAVERVKARFDASMRTMFQATPGWYLVGTDAESIQLRVLAHYLQNQEYVDAIVNGKKEDETDIHNLNRRALGLEHLTRDHAKTFIYAWLLGAGVEKVGRILACNRTTAHQAVENFVQRTEGLSELRDGRIRTDAGRGWFVGLDGRKVLNDSDYLMLAGYLQNGESVVMKHANILWRQLADEQGITYRQVNFVHDEWQTETPTYEEAELLGKLQCDSLRIVGEELKLFCPMSGETRIGRNWLETH